MIGITANFKEGNIRLSVSCYSELSEESLLSRFFAKPQNDNFNPENEPLLLADMYPETGQTTALQIFTGFRR